MQQTTVLANTLDLKFCSVTIVYWEFVLYNNSERLELAFFQCFCYIHMYVEGMNERA